MTAPTKRTQLLLFPLLGLVLMTAACFRPAGETVQDTIGGAVDSTTSEQSEPIAGASADDGVNVGNAGPTATAPSFVMEMASTLPSDVSASNNPASTLAITVIPLNSAVETPTSAPLIVTLANVTTMPTFITPGAPLAPITLEPGAPFPGTTGEGGALEVLPTQPASGLITPTSLPGTGDDCLYIVQPGDSLYQIALNQGVTLQEMRAANPNLVGENPLLQIGQQLNLPGCGDAGNAVEVAAPVATPTPVSATTGETQGQEYVVQRGDTLYGIALRYGVTVQAIINANVGRLADPNRIQIGDRLIIPTRGN